MGTQHLRVVAKEELMDCELKEVDIWSLTARVGGYIDGPRFDNIMSCEVEKYIREFVSSSYFIHLKNFSEYGKLTVAFYWFLMSRQIGISMSCSRFETLTELCFTDPYYRGWVLITPSKWKKVKDCLAMVGVSWDKDTQNTIADLVSFLDGDYKVEKKETVEKDLFTSVVAWKEVCKKLKKSKEYDEMNEQEQVMEEQNEEQAVEEQVEQTVEVQAQEEPVVEEEPMEERDMSNEEAPVVEEQQVVDKKVQHAEANRRYKEKKEAERVATAAAVAEVIDYFKSIGKWEEIREDTRTILMKYAYKTTGNSIVAKVFGDCVKVGDTVTVEQVFRITQMGIKEFQKKLNDWEQKDGVKVEYKENPDNIFASTYTIVEC